MNITLNRESVELPQQEPTVSQLMDERGLPQKSVVVAVNDAVLRRDEWTERIIREGDEVEIIHAVAARGKGVLVVSSEAEELLSLCHRILVMRNGKIVAEFDPDQADTDDLIRTALTHQD